MFTAYSTQGQLKPRLILAEGFWDGLIQAAAYLGPNCHFIIEVVLYGVPSPPKIKVDHNIQLDSITFDLRKINIRFCSSIL